MWSAEWGGHMTGVRKTGPGSEPTIGGGLGVAGLLDLERVELSHKLLADRPGTRERLLELGDLRPPELAAKDEGVAVHGQLDPLVASSRFGHHVHRRAHVSRLDPDLFLKGA